MAQSKKVAASDRDRVDQTVARNLKKFRALRGHSQQELGKRLDLTFQQIQKYEKGTNSIPTGYLRQLCAVLDITPSDLYGPISTRNGPAPTLSALAIREAQSLDAMPEKARSFAVSLIRGLAELME